MNYYDIGVLQSDRTTRIEELKYKLANATELHLKMFSTEWKKEIKQLERELKKLDQFHKQLFKWSEELASIKA